MKLPQWIQRLLGLFRKKEPPRVEPPKQEAPRIEPKPQPPAPSRKKIPSKCSQTGKRCYADRAIAARERDRLAANTPNGYLRIYTCEFCGYWHLTHKKRYKW